MPMAKCPKKVGILPWAFGHLKTRGPEANSQFNIFNEPSWNLWFFTHSFKEPKCGADVGRAGAKVRAITDNGSYKCTSFSILAFCHCEKVRNFLQLPEKAFFFYIFSHSF